MDATVRYMEIAVEGSKRQVLVWAGSYLSGSSMASMEFCAVFVEIAQIVNEC